MDSCFEAICVNKYLVIVSTQISYEGIREVLRSKCTIHRLRKPMQPTMFLIVNICTVVMLLQYWVYMFVDEIK